MHLPGNFDFALEAFLFVDDFMHASIGDSDGGLVAHGVEERSILRGERRPALLAVRELVDDHKDSQYLVLHPKRHGDQCVDAEEIGWLLRDVITSRCLREIKQLAILNQFVEKRMLVKIDRFGQEELVDVLDTRLEVVDQQTLEGWVGSLHHSGNQSPPWGKPTRILKKRVEEVDGSRLRLALAHREIESESKNVTEVLSRTALWTPRAQVGRVFCHTDKKIKHDLLFFCDNLGRPVCGPEQNHVVLEEQQDQTQENARIADVEPLGKNPHLGRRVGPLTRIWLELEGDVPPPDDPPHGKQDANRLHERNHLAPHPKKPSQEIPEYAQSPASKNEDGNPVRREVRGLRG